MHFKVMCTLRASRVEKWTWHIYEEFLNGAHAKCVSLDCEFTDTPEK
jgi:hypothetical protein